MSGNERIDHAAEAARVLRDVSADSNGTYADAMAYAQIHATLALVEQQRIANKLAVALVDQLTEIAPYLTPLGAVVDPRISIRDYLHTDEWQGLDL